MVIVAVDDDYAKAGDSEAGAMLESLRPRWREAERRDPRFTIEDAVLDSLGELGEGAWVSLNG